MADSWEQVASCQITSSGVQGDISASISELPVGTQGLLRLEGPGIGPIFDAWGMEQIVQQVFNAQGVDATVIDCYGEGWNTGYIRFHASPLPIIPLLWAIAAVLAAIGLIITIVVLTLYVIKPVSEAISKIPGGWIALAIGGLVIGGLYVASKVSPRRPA